MTFVFRALLITIALRPLVLPIPIVTYFQGRTGRCASIFESEFGKSVSSRIALYSLNKDYALQAWFGKGCEIQKIDVAPKYTWEYIMPEWTEPGYLVSASPSQYDEMIRRISRVKNLGALKRVIRSKIVIVTNAKELYWEEYEHAFVWRADHLSGDNDPSRSHSFTIYFLRPITGKVIAYEWARSPESSKIPKVQIDDHWYLMPEETVATVRIGKRTTYMVAGPMY